MANFEVFSIDLTALERVVGSKDLGIVEQIVAPDDPPELRAAMTSIVARGARPFPGDSFSLAHVTLRLCRVVGRRINGNTCDLLEADGLDRAEEITAPLGLGASILELIMAGDAPIRGLPVDAEISFGVIDASRIPAAFARWARAYPVDPVSDDADGLLAEMLDWLEVAAARGESLVGAFWD